MATVLGYELEWFDQVSGILKTMYLKYFVYDNTIEILQDKSSFLKRIYYPEITYNDLFIGNSVTIFNRLFLIKSYANIATETYILSRQIVLLCVASNVNTIGKFITLANSNGFQVGRIRTTSSSICAAGLDVSSGDILIEIVAMSGDKLSDLSARASAITGISITPSTSQQLTEVFAACTTVIVPEQCTLCLIKPHILRSRKAGDFLTAITQANFQISGLFAIHLTMTIAEELFDVYRTLHPSYCAMLTHMTSGPTLAVLVTGGPPGCGNIVQEFREFCGPDQPALAVTLRPNSLRARFGVNPVENGMHCTDLPEDSQMECRYFFETLAGL